MKTKLLFSFLLFFQISIFAQNRFEASVVVGLNYAELEGSSIIDFFGPNVGLIGTAKLTNRCQLSMELLYSQNGEYILPISYPRIEYGRIRLNHVEVPVRFNWLVSSGSKTDEYNWNFNAGIAYTRLINHYAEDFENNEVSDEIIYDKRDGFILQGGLIYSFNEHWGLNLRASLPLILELDWTFAVRMVYTIL